MSRFSIVGPIHPLRGGIAQHTSGIATEARGRGHDVRVFSYRRQYPSFLFPGRTQLDEGPPPAAARVGVEASIDSLNPWSWWRTGRAVDASRPDLVLLQRWHPFFAPALSVVASVVRPRTRVVWMVHNARPHEGGAPWGPLLRVGYRDGDHAVVHAEIEREALAALGVRSTPIHVPMPAAEPRALGDRDEARRRLALPADDVVFLFFGHVRAYKGVEVLIDALARLPEAGPGWRAIVAGEWYVDRAPVESRIAATNLGDRVRIEDRFLTEDEMDERFAAATVVVLPYVAGTQSAVVPLAYRYGRAVVTTRVGGVPEIVRDGETGLLVPPRDAGALAAALERVRGGERFPEEVVRSAARRFSYAALVDALEAIVREPLFP